MALIEWRDEFSTGVAAVDHEHQELIDLINSLHEQMARGSHSPDEIETFLGEIHAKISAHFALEERVMREEGYSRLASHKADHERLLDDMREIMINYDAGAYASFEATLAEHLNEWFSNHFRTHDALLHGELGDHHHLHEH